MGLELKTNKGKLVHVRETGRMDEMWDDEDFWNEPPCSAPAPLWPSIMVLGFVFVMVGVTIYCSVHG